MIGTWRRVLLLVLLLLYGNERSVLAQNITKQRYLSLMMLNLRTGVNDDLDILEGGVKAGCNAVHLAIHWDLVYPKANSQPNWQKYDTQINLCQKLGVKIALRIYVGRGMNAIDGFWTQNECQRDDRGRPLKAIYDKTAFSFAHRPSVDKACDFVREVCQRYNTLQNQGIISWVSVAQTTAQEIGYDHVNFTPDGAPQGAVYDYSPAMQDEFRIFLSRKYKKIARLNANWDTDFSRFEDIGPPTSSIDPNQVFYGAKGRDWYLFRHLMLRAYIERTTETIKNVNKSYQVILDFGSVFDPMSGSRGSYGFTDLSRTTDGVKINDYLNYDHRFSTDVVRSNVGNKWVMNEVFPEEKYPESKVQEQIDQNFAHGAQWVNIILHSTAWLNRLKDILQKSNEKWVKPPFMEVIPKRGFTYSLARVAEFGYFDGGVYNQWATQAGPESNRQPVDLKMIDDLLADSLQGTLNRVPIVKNAIPSKVVRVNTVFSYKLSSEIFADIDGVIVKIEALNLPNWLKFSNNTLTGIPPQTGTYNFILKATDDDGASTETTFGILVDNNGRLNRKPVLRKPIVNVVGLYKQAFIFQIPDSTFFDPDGFVTRIEVTPIPKWAQYRKGEFRGVPNQAAEYTINVRAFDDEEASVETSFKIVINYPSVFFDLIEGGPPGKRRLIQRLKANDQLLAHTLPNSLNVYAACDAAFDNFELELSGPYSQSTKTTRSPFSLFDGDEGFPTVVGTYQLKGTAYFRQQLVASTTYLFRIVPTDATTKQPRELEDWAVYPNPFNEFINVKLPNNAPAQGWRLELTTLNGQTVPLPVRSTIVLNKLLTLNTNSLGMASGTYLLKLTNETGEVKSFKVVKQ